VKRPGVYVTTGATGVVGDTGYTGVQGATGHLRVGSYTQVYILAKEQYQV